MSRRNIFDSILDFYRTAPADQVRAVLFLETEILAERGISLAPPPKREVRRRRRLNDGDKGTRFSITNTHTSEIAKGESA